MSSGDVARVALVDLTVVFSFGVPPPSAVAGFPLLVTAKVMATDPVCGMQIEPATASQHRDTRTGTVSFCSVGCAAAFDAEPQR